MSLHSCNQYCSDNDLHFAQKALGIDDVDELREYLELLLTKIKR